jgi:glyceraldehyde 3-phosphate dehydrogenase
MKVAINGFGRIGRAVLRICLEKGINVVAINNPGTIDDMVYLLKYDSVYGPYKHRIEKGKDYIKVKGKKIIVSHELDPEKLPWKKLGIDVVVESTGVFRDREGASKHLTAGAKKVVISAPAKDPDMTIVVGVNHNELKPKHKILSNASCTTNCLAPIIKCVNDSVGIENAYMTTIHAYTNDQVLLDVHHKKDRRRGRGAAINLIPTTTGAATAVTEVIPELKGKINGMAIRAPVPVGSLVDLTITVPRNTSVEKVNNAIKRLSQTRLKGIIEYSEDEIVSSDIIGNPHSAIFDSRLTQVNGRLVKLYAWYDNEWGYSNRVVDLLQKLK